MSEPYFHFTLGPVQSFVAQARRTRDFWAGSFILSWLSAVAMQAVQKQEGSEILFPVPDAAFLKALESGEDGGRQGSVPNRFKARVGDGFDPGQVTRAVGEAWRALAEAVWRLDFADRNLPATRAVWDRQIPAFWEIQWVRVEKEETTDALDRFKNWRAHLPPDEPGVKCMMMDGWQELSGAERPSRKDLDAFWEQLRDSGREGIATDLRPGEALCAIAYVKRRFARCFHKVACDLGGWTLRGWELPTAVPSVHYMAAAHWLAGLIERAHADPGVEARMHSFHEDAVALTGGHPERDNPIRCVREAAQKAGQPPWQALDGTAFFATMLQNPRLWTPKAEEAQTLARALGELREAAKLGPPSPFYAVLRMDGDELGRHLANPKYQAAISKGLDRFTRGVHERVDAHSGFLIYAGGDDVLALLPLEDALPCALALRQHYLACFEDTPLAGQTSLSGAIEYAHAKMPLGRILADSHRLLDEVAKEGRGRDAIACRVWKPGGQVLEWAMPWEKALTGDGTQVQVQALADAFRARIEDGRQDLAQGFFYRIRERLDAARIGEPDILGELLAMEYLNSGLADKDWTLDRARVHIAPLLAQCRQVRRERNGATRWAPMGTTADGALLVRFLAQKGENR